MFEDLFDMSLNENASGGTITTEPLAKAVSINVPGLSEKPSNSGYNDDYTKINIPGLSEKPSAGEYNDGYAKVSIPAGATITDSAYNAAIANLHKTFKESAAMMEILQNVKVVPAGVTTESLQEEAIANAIYESIINGPLFEAVDASDKSKVRRIVSKLKGKMEEACEDVGGARFVKPSWIARFLLDPTGLGAAQAFAAAVNNRLYQILGILYLEEGNLRTIIDGLNKKFSSELEEYKILETRIMPSLIDIIRTKFGWKNTKNAFLLVVDKKLPSELSAAGLKSASADAPKQDTDDAESVKAKKKNKKKKKFSSNPDED